MIRKKHITPEARKTQILAAADLVLIEVGFEKFTIDQVIHKAGIAKGTVYNYYKNKDQMLSELSHRALALLHKEFVEYCEKYDSSIEKIKAICLASYYFYKNHPEYFELLLYMERPEFTINVKESMRLSINIQAFVMEMVDEGQRKGEISNSYSAEMVQYILWASCMGVVQFVESKKNMLKNYREINVKELVETFSIMITEGIKA